MQVNTTATPLTQRVAPQTRVTVQGKFLYCNGEKFYVKGVTYGTFAPQPDGSQFPTPVVVDTDFSLMARHGINCVRTYTTPPRYVLDLALRHGLKVMAGLPWEQHITFLDGKERRQDILRRVKASVLACEQHPALLCYAIGNEIPAPVVRWYGKEKVEAFLQALYRTVKTADPGGLVTYVNYPTTEYLDLSFLDFDCFNVYLETPEKLRAYLARLHNIAGNRPLVLAEVGLDSLRNGEQRQAETLAWQCELIFGQGCAGMFVFAWTDDWWRGGSDIEDWDFGLVDRKRNPKPALAAVSEALHAVPVAITEDLPFMSVVVCSYNGSATIRDCMEGLQRLEYPHFEVIVVNDGSTDMLAEIVAEYPVTLISTPNMGLSSARNTGLHRAQGEIVAYIDDDAYPDPHWLQYLAYAYRTTTHAGMGGPNIVPPEDGPIAQCVANAPGGPVHVLITDEVAEHIPGCNMTFRRAALLAVGGFDDIFRSAGDDVDVCWKIQATGQTIGYHPAALVWHHRRNSLKAYWKQQKGYGKAEALLEAKWPENYNGFGHLAWAGRIYGNSSTLPINLRKEKIFYGTWGSALFQSIYEPADAIWNVIPLMPEWYILIALLGGVATLGLMWPPLQWVWLLFGLAVVVIVAQAALSAHKNQALQPAQSRPGWATLLTIGLHLVQPVARLYGRLKHGLTPWRKKGAGAQFRFFFAFSNVFTRWSETWHAPEEWLTLVEEGLTTMNTRVKRGGDFEEWDIEARNGLFAYGRALLLVEEHGGGKQLLRLRCWSNFYSNSLIALGLLLTLSGFAAFEGEVVVAIALFLLTLATGFQLMRGAASCMNTIYSVFNNLPETFPANAPSAATKAQS
jgi:glycosyltransferase involved in cell wall biosynthesis